jgi:mono/diheme cytochrome c family protein
MGKRILPITGLRPCGGNRKGRDGRADKERPMRSTWFPRLAALSALTLAGSAWAGDPPARTPELLEKGKASFTKYCATCHGAKGEGDGVAGKLLKPPPRNFRTDPFKNGSQPGQIFETLANGVKGTPMVAYKHLPEEERWALAYYVQSLKDEGARK